MNLRTITLRYLGWCPGVKAAARFLPDRDIPPTRILMMAALVPSVFISSFFVVHRSLITIGYPSPPICDISIGSPKLVVVEDQPYIAVELETIGTLSPAFGPVFRSKIFLAKLSLDGRLEDETVILDLGERAELRSMDLLLTKDGRWYLAYKYVKCKEWPERGETVSDLYVIHSDDGRLWSKPTVIAHAHARDPSLMETKDGEIFLSFSSSDEIVFYSIFRSETGWSSPAEIPLRIEDPSSFLDRDGKIGVVGVDYDYDASEIKGIALTKMEENGSWTNPRYLSYLTIPIKGRKPEIFYSRIRDGYFLIIRHPRWPSERRVQGLFTPDLENWELPGFSFMNAWEGSLVELANGTLVSVFIRIVEEPRGYEFAPSPSTRDLCISTSSDGVNWTTPRKVKQIMDEEALEIIQWELVSGRRGTISMSTSLVITACAALLVYKRSKLGSGLSHRVNKRNTSTATRG